MPESAKMSAPQCRGELGNRSEKRLDAYGSAPEGRNPPPASAAAPSRTMALRRAKEKREAEALVEHWRAIIRSREQSALRNSGRSAVCLPIESLLSGPERSRLAAGGLCICKRPLCEKGRVFRPRRTTQQHCSPDCRKRHWFETHVYDVTRGAWVLAKPPEMKC